ncbi:MAG: hypothetical protein NC308_09445, partial [Clostridium sp.]|nr:hypothetical protein [Clostridium sp.]
QGYYPFSLENQGIHIQHIVNLALESDIPQYAGMNVSTGRKLKQLLAIIAKSVPFKPNISSIATALNVSRNSVPDYCLYVERQDSSHSSETTWAESGDWERWIRYTSTTRT